MASRTDAFHDTIAAVITPPGEGGVAGLRLAGPRSREIFTPLFQVSSDESVLTPFMMRHGWIVDRGGVRLDEVLAVFMPAGRSYTGLDQIELFCHGGQRVVQRLLAALLEAGARSAEPGEFTRLAFENGRIDLTQAEAVAEIIAATTDRSLQAAGDHLAGSYREHIETLREQLLDLLAEIEAGIDYPEERLTPDERVGLAGRADRILAALKKLKASYTGGRILREGFRIAVAGRPNAGKSSLFNLLVNKQRALVTPTAGTTRDYLSEWIDLGGYMVELIDTAGLRPKGGAIERAGQASARSILGKADLVLWLVDLGRRNWQKDWSTDHAGYQLKRKLLIGNKIDTITKAGRRALEPEHGSGVDVLLSCKSHEGLPELQRQIERAIAENMPDLTDGHVVTSARHRQKLSVASRHTKAARDLIQAGESPEIIAFELRLGMTALDEITGKIYNEEVLGRIFARFCVGK